MDALLSRPSSSSYDAVAAEYYDPRLHPTCDDFRRATRGLLDDFLDAVPAGPGRLLEVGGGRSLLAERLLARGRASLAGLTVTDASAAMLGHSAPLAAAGAVLRVAAADALPFDAAAFDVVVACLGDPYNRSSFWAEVRRVLAPAGRCFFSTPSFEWSRTFRDSAADGALEAAEFAVGAEVVVLPSFIFPRDELIAMIEATGLRVEAVRDITAEGVDGGVRSGKLAAARAAGAPIVTAYWASRSA